MHFTNTLKLAVLCGLAPPAIAAFDGFAPRVDLPLAAGHFPTASALADFNNDGKLDIAVTAFTSQSLDRVAIFLNNGDGTFATPAYYSVGDSPIAIVAADVNLDGKADILTANRDTDDFSVRLGNGDGTFGGEAWWATGARPQDIAVADLNADGYPDAAIVNESDDSVSVFFNDGDGTFTLNATYTTNNPDGNFGNGPRGLDAADLNFDGLPDLITANTTDDTGTILYNISGVPGAFYNGEFALFVPLNQGPIAVDAHDHDGDGDIDLVFACTGGTIQRRLNEFNDTPGTVFPDFPTEITFTIDGSRPVGLCTADFGDLPLSTPRSPDADRDLVIADELLSDIDILLNIGNGSVIFGGRHDAASSPQRPSAGDLDGDGDHDVVTPQYGDASIGVFFNSSTIVGGPAPVVRIDVPGDYGAADGCVCGPTQTVSGVASIPAGGVFHSYLLRYRPVSDPTGWATIASADTPVNEPGGTLGAWNLGDLPEGFYLISLRAESASGLSANEEAVVWVSQQYNTLNTAIPPIVGSTACITGTANDDSCGPNSYTVDYRPAAGGAFQPVDPDNPTYTGDRLNQTLATWDTPGVPDGNYQIRVNATNGCSQTATQLLPVTVDNTPPIAEITSPLNCFWFNADQTIGITGTASDQNLAAWSVQYSGGPFNTWRTITSGSGNVVNGLLAQWNTEGLPPCAYTLRLVVSDAATLNCNNAIEHTSVFLTTVNLGCRADLAEPFLLLDLADVVAFVESFTAGCP